MGLGRYLMTRLVKWARSKKLDSIYGDVLEHNQPMLALSQSLGFEREVQHDARAWCGSGWLGPAAPAAPSPPTERQPGRSRRRRRAPGSAAARRVAAVITRTARARPPAPVDRQPDPR